MEPIINQEGSCGLDPSENQWRRIVNAVLRIYEPGGEFEFPSAGLSPTAPSFADHAVSFLMALGWEFEFRSFMFDGWWCRIVVNNNLRFFGEGDYYTGRALYSALFAAANKIEGQKSPFYKGWYGE